LGDIACVLLDSFFTTMMTRDSVLPLILSALQEDISFGDITAEAIFSSDTQARAEFLVKHDGVVCGLDCAKWVCEEVAAQGNDTTFRWSALASDGDAVTNGTVVTRVEGTALTLLKAERTALNFMQRMSGVATLTRTYVRTLEGTHTRVADTRKTIPGWRLLDKYAVKMGGGMNHRIGLFDMALIKDNHRDAAGSLTAAIRRCNEALQNSPQTPIEAETRTFDDVREVLSCLDNGLRVERIMFDNFTPNDVRTAVALVAGRTATEASGGITLENIRLFAEAGVDIISVGALTHSAPALDISMKFR
jgi:nicotinate-nucleotide pyrophosphorylase (carboxylating)